MTKAAALKKRYIACELKFADNSSRLSDEEAKYQIYNEGSKFFGEYLLSFVALKFVSLDQANRIAILRCNRDFVSETLGFLALVSSLNGRRARMISLATSGSIKGLKEKIKNN
ncbi:MAG: Rpp14/Pop5 family protein [Candidatus Micrarchaeota archaeon]